jgi:hypothetical protein
MAGDHDHVSGVDPSVDGLGAVAMNQLPGHGIHEHVFSRAEVDGVLDALSRAEVPRTKAGARHILTVPDVRAMATDPRLMSIAATYVGSGATPFRATLFEKCPAANWLVSWHQDTTLPLREQVDDSQWGPWSTKAGVLHARAPAWALERVIALRVSLDDSTMANGPLRVLPDTHCEGVLNDERIAELARRIPAVDSLAAAGGVVTMRPLTVHASSKSVSDKPRRVLHIEYAVDLELGPGLALAIA